MSEKVDAILLAYVDRIRADLEVRWTAWPLDFSKNEVHEVIGALLARQVSLASNFVKSPGMWNSHMAPLVLRAMADVYITLSWILKDPADRARRLIMFGLGQAKLQVEHRKAQIDYKGDSAEEDPVIDALLEWIESQRYMFLTEVDVGSWSGLSVRKMAEDADCLDFYRYVYMPFSSSAHSMWNHIGRLNLEMCTSPFHKGHKLPIDPDLDVDISYLHLAAKYMDKAFLSFDKELAMECPPSSAMSTLLTQIENLSNTGESSSDSEN